MKTRRVRHAVAKGDYDRACYYDATRILRVAGRALRAGRAVNLGAMLRGEDPRPAGHFVEES